MLIVPPGMAICPKRLPAISPVGKRLLKNIILLQFIPVEIPIGESYMCLTCRVRN